MAFLDKNGLQVLTNKLVQGDAIKVASHRGHTIKNVINNITRECENVVTPNTMTLENRVKEFKVGQGRDVDVSGDVEEGKIEVELQGKTYQNLLGGLKGTPSGVNATNTVVDNGDKTITITRGAESTNTHVGVYFDLNKSCLKENQTYTIIINVIENTLPNGMYLVDSNYTGFTPSKTISSNQTGIIRYSVTYTGTGANRWWIWTLRDTKFGKVTFSYPILLEGDYTQTPVEEIPKYFEGIKSSFEDGVVDVEVRGKNLFDGSYRFGYLQGGDTPLYIDRDSGATRSVILKVKPNTTYNISKEYSIRNTIGLFKDYPINNTPYTPIPLNINGTRVNTGDNNYMVVYVSNESEEPWLQVEEGFVATPYEPYYKKKISFNIGESLRSLPNGVCDEIRNNNGQWELVRRIGHTLLVGTENWINEGCQNQVNTSSFRVNTKYPNSKANGLIISDKLPSIDNGWSNDVDGIFMTSYLTIRLTKTKLSATTPEGVKAWFSNNNTNVFYELETPVVTPIEPIEFEVKPLATITINSDIAPTSNHKVILNRAGQIEQGIVQIAELKSRVDVLETAYDSYLLETQHKLSLLGFEYELESEEI